MSPKPAPQALGFDECARDLVRDLHVPAAKVFWADLVLTAVVGWGAFWAAIVLDSFASVFALAISALAIYRGVCFIHELTHLRPRSLPGFENAWNLLFGLPLLLPSFVYVGVHQDHHRITTYGTPRDPEYMPFARSNLMMLAFVAHSVLIPAFLLLRFVVLSPVSLLIPPLHRWLAVRASALSMNITYRRYVSRGLTSTMKIWEVLIFAVWAPLFAGMSGRIIPWRVLIAWYAVSATASVINTLRTLGAHHYQSLGEPLDRTGQLLDSIDTPGSLWTELWAPVGLRYHALHHYFPGIPYHNLGEAHRRLSNALPSEAPYRATVSSGLLRSLRNLYRRGRSARVTHTPSYLR
jgi:fatty acid desaturase